MEAIFVAEGEVVEKVFDGEDAAVGEAGGDAVADALDEFNGRGELERHGLMVAAEVLRKTVAGGAAQGWRVDEIMKARAGWRVFVAAACCLVSGCLLFLRWTHSLLGLGIRWC